METQRKNRSPKGEAKKLEQNPNFQTGKALGALSDLITSAQRVLDHPDSETCKDWLAGAITRGRKVYRELGGLNENI